MESSIRNDDVLDAAVVGGGPAGLAAALWLARYGRRIRVYDAGRPRNAETYAVHGYPGVPDATPASLRRRMLDQALGAGAEMVDARVLDITSSPEGERFRVEADGRPPAASRRILLASGRRDLLPDVPGIDRWVGRFVFHCPDCDGPSMAGERVGVIGWDRHAVAIAVLLDGWAERVVLLTQGRAVEDGVLARERAILDRCGIGIETDRVAGIVDRAGRGRGVRLEDGREIAMDGLFIGLGSVPANDLADRIGCRVNEGGEPVADEAMETTVPGVYVAGDLAGHPHLVVAAVERGVRAALGMHRSLLPRALRL